MRRHSASEGTGLGGGLGGGGGGDGEHRPHPARDAGTRRSFDLGALGEGSSEGGGGGDVVCYHGGSAFVGVCFLHFCFNRGGTNPSNFSPATGFQL